MFLIHDLCTLLEAYLEPNQVKEVYRAYLFGAEAHEGQHRLSGEPYIYHPLEVARILADMRMDYSTITAALLHDVVEDTAITSDQLKEMGFSETVLEALDSVTKRAGETYEDFVRRAALHQIGKKIKLADLRDNMDLSRLEEITDEDIKRVKKYHGALKIIKG